MSFREEITVEAEDNFLFSQKFIRNVHEDATSYEDRDPVDEEMITAVCAPQPEYGYNREFLDELGINGDEDCEAETVSGEESCCPCLEEVFGTCDESPGRDSEFDEQELVEEETIEATSLPEPESFYNTQIFGDDDDST